MRCDSFIVEIENKTLKNTGLVGWGTGYIVIPFLHPLYGMHYHNAQKYVTITEELTFSDSTANIVHGSGEIKNGWIFGWDSGHIYNSHYTKSDVRIKTEDIKKEFEQVSWFSKNFWFFLIRRILFTYYIFKLKKDSK